MTSDPSPTIAITRHLPFTAERVFDAWLEPAFAARWLFATPSGNMVRAEVDPRVGGRFTFTDRRGDQEVEHTGEYLEISRPRRLVFTFGVPAFSPNLDRVTIEIEPRGENCVLTLTHELKRENLGYKHRSKYGWSNILANLAANLGDRRAISNQETGHYLAPGEVRLERLLPGPIERVWEYLTDSEKRGRWFAGGPMELRPGGRAELLFRHINLSPEETPEGEKKQYHDPGETMIGEVTRCEPPRLLAFCWPIDEATGAASEVTFELTPQGDDVALVLTHRRLGPDRDLLISVGAGWHTHVAIMIALVSGDTVPPFWAMHGALKATYGALLEKELPA